MLHPAIADVSLNLFIIEDKVVKVEGVGRDLQKVPFVNMN